MTRKKPRRKEQMSLPIPDFDDVRQQNFGVTIPLETEQDYTEEREHQIQAPDLPTRWEIAKDSAEKKKVLPALLRQIRRVKGIELLELVTSLSRDEGYVWVIYGESGSGKSAFFDTLEYQTDNQIKKHIIHGNQNTDLANVDQLYEYLSDLIQQHKRVEKENTPLVIVLEERENYMSPAERSTISQVLKNILRRPGLGSGVIFVLPVTNSEQGSLFLDQVKSTGVATLIGSDALYTFQGPTYTEHVDILTDLFITLNDTDISEFGLQRSDLQAYVSDRQTIGQYIRLVKQKLDQQNRRDFQIIKSHNYKPLSVVVCFINPLPGYRTEPIVKAMTHKFGKIRTGEILGSTHGQRSQRWQNKHQALRNIISTLDMRVVEIPPHIIAKLVYAYGWQKPTSKDYSDNSVLGLVEEYLDEEDINYNAAKNIRQNLRQQLIASNLFKVITGQETQSYPTPRFSKQSSDKSNRRKKIEQAEIAITQLACQESHKRQHELHSMLATSIDDLFQHSSHIANVADYKHTLPEAWITVGGDKKLRVDVVIEMQDRLFLLEFCWRSEEHFTYADISSYVLRKIQDSYLNLPLIATLASI